MAGVIVAAVAPALRLRLWPFAMVAEVHAQDAPPQPSGAISSADFGTEGRRQRRPRQRPGVA